MSWASRFARRPRITSVACGLLFAASFPPLPLGFLSSLCWIPMLFMVERRTRSQVIWDFFAFGLAACGGTLYWVGNVLAPGLWFRIVAGLVLLCCYFALYYAAAGWGAFALFQRWGPKGMLFFPPLWVLLEYARSLTELSFPWMTSGYTWGDWLPLIQALSIVGVYGYSLLSAGVGACGYLLLRMGWRDPPARAFCLSLCLTVIAMGVWGSCRMKGSRKGGAHARVMMVQSNVDQLTKWDAAFVDSTFHKHVRMTRQMSATERPDFVVWPETSLPMYVLKRFYYLEQLRSFVDSLDVPLLFGSLHYQRVNQRYQKVRFFNCAFWYDPKAGRMDRYEKIRLVPFSEYLPFSNLFPVINRVDLGEADFSSGKRMRVFEAGPARFSPSICYEIIYPAFVRRAMRTGCNLLVNITNDGWFGRSSAAFQHMNMARFRCVENRIPLARCANTGVTAIVDTDGRIRKKTRVFRDAVLMETVPLGQGEITFYGRFGDWIVVLCAFSCVWALGIPLARSAIHRLGRDPSGESAKSRA